MSGFNSTTPPPPTDTADIVSPGKLPPNRSDRLKDKVSAFGRWVLRGLGKQLPIGRGDRQLKANVEAHHSIPGETMSDSTIHHQVEKRTEQALSFFDALLNNYDFHLEGENLLLNDKKSDGKTNIPIKEILDQIDWAHIKTNDSHFEKHEQILLSYSMSDYTQPPTLASDRKKYISEFGVKEYINTDSSTYQDINRLLRHGKAPLFLSSKSPDLHIKTILIKILMATSYVNQNRLENPKTLYRRMTVKNLDDLVNAYQPGSIISEPAFTSTGKQDEWNGNILYVIHADSESGSDLSHLNQECGGEILFRPGTRFKVLKVEPNSEASSTGRPSELTIFLTTFEKGDNHGSDTEV